MHAPKLRKAILSLLLIVGLLVLGAGSIYFGAMLREEPQRGAAEAQPLVVTGQRLEKTDVVEQIRGYGLAQPIRRASISAQVQGTIESIPGAFRVGRFVEKGKVLLELDQTEFVARRDAAEAAVAEVREQIQQNAAEQESLEEQLDLTEQDVEVAEREFQRAEELFREGVASESARDQAQTALQAVKQQLSETRRRLKVLQAQEQRLQASLRARQSDLAVAEENLDYTTPTAPFSGYIEERLVDEGDLVRPGRVMFVLIDPAMLEMPIEVSASHALALRTGADVEVQTDENPPRTATGRVDRISPSVRTQNRTVTAYIILDNTKLPDAFNPGTFLKASVSGRTFEGVYAVPRSAIVDGYIFLDEDGTATRVEPDFFVYLDELALTRDVLGEGNILITSGFENLYENAPVRTELPGETQEQPGKAGAEPSVAQGQDGSVADS